MVRSHLMLGKNDVPPAKLKSLWKALDEDSSGYIDAGEFGRFMKKGIEFDAKAPNARQKLVSQRAAETTALRAARDLFVGRETTARLTSVVAASEEEVDAIAQLLAVKTVDLFPFSERAWFKLFRIVDDEYGSSHSHTS